MRSSKAMDHPVSPSPPLRAAELAPLEAPTTSTPFNEAFRGDEAPCPHDARAHAQHHTHRAPQPHVMPPEASICLVPEVVAQRTGLSRAERASRHLVVDALPEPSVQQPGETVGGDGVALLSPEEVDQAGREIYAEPTAKRHPHSALGTPHLAGTGGFPLLWFTPSR